MSTTTQLGNIKVKIGEYHNDRTGKPSPKSLTLGKLMMTEHSDGTRRIWGKLQLHLLHASLYALVKPYVEKGETEFSINVFKDDDAPARSAAGPAATSPRSGPAMDDDDVSF